MASSEAPAPRGGNGQYHTLGNERPEPPEIADHGHFLAKPYRSAEVIRENEDLTQEADARLRPGPGQ